MWNFGDLLDATARATPPDRPALVFGDATTSWGAFDRRTNNLARGLLAEGLVAGDRVAILSRNHPAYIEAAVAALKARLTYVNLNYRYTADEIAYVLNDCDARALVYQDEFSPIANDLPTLAPGLARFVCVGAEATSPPGAASFEALAARGDGGPLDIRRSPDDEHLVYTGGTTGRPKGVVWRSHDARATQLESPLVKSVPRDLAEHAALVAANAQPGRVIPACPLMHGAGINSSMAELVAGGTVITLASRRFDADELWAAAERNRATRILIVGDAFARPMVAALDADPGRYDLSALKTISSSGLIWSAEMKAALLKRLPNLTLLDIFGSSEVAGLGYSVSNAARLTPTGMFEAGPNVSLIDPDTDTVIPSGVAGTGLIARSGHMAVGYYNDPAKTAEVYRVIEGVRYAIPGDMAERTEDGLIRLIGRGNLCINTGGEKVFPEEVEEVLKRDPAVEDVLVVGVPDPTWGKVVVGLVRGCEGFDAKAVTEAASRSLAKYKLPKRIFQVPDIPRHESGKSDYRRAAEIAAALMDGETSAAASR